MKELNSRTVVKYAIALLLAVRCRSEDGTKQLLAKYYHEMSEKQARIFMNRTIMLLEPRERDWLKLLC